MFFYELLTANVKGVCVRMGCSVFRGIVDEKNVRMLLYIFDICRGLVHEKMFTVAEPQLLKLNWSNISSYESKQKNSR